MRRTALMREILKMRFEKVDGGWTARLFHGMMIHQDGSRHEWVLWKKGDLIVTLDDKTSEHYSMFLFRKHSPLFPCQPVWNMAIAFN